MTKKREIAVLVANEKQMAMLMTEKMMTEEMEEKIMTEEVEEKMMTEEVEENMMREGVEEKVTCFDCNVSVLPSEIQVATNKHFLPGSSSNLVFRCTIQNTMRRAVV